eukprot:TRINITY_DN2648_c0_g3_i12.p1 TRINITY_DN2648_c0_g3~~TRINITY_DN2648_c0_g3_i12.p1  ORF type:complete len:232 (+),score=44.45 TRINITY_DN2648_c0_g3_i12:145-840(+)
MQPGYTNEPTNHKVTPLEWATNRDGLVIIQTPDWCARQKFRIFDSHGEKQQVMRTDTEFACSGECCPTDASVFITGADGNEMLTHKIISSDTGCMHPQWKFREKDGKKIATASLRNECDDCGCPPSLEMQASAGNNTFYTKPKDKPACCDGMCCPDERYEFDIVKKSDGNVVAKAAKLPLNTLESWFLGVNNYSIAFSDPKTTPEERAAMVTMIVAADFHYWKPSNHHGGE